MKATRLKYRRADYVSDFEAYLREYVARHPNVEPDQRRGWSIWWDRQVDQGELKVRREDAVPVRGYQYD